MNNLSIKKQIVNLLFCVAILLFGVVACSESMSVEESQVDAVAQQTNDSSIQEEASTMVDEAYPADGAYPVAADAAYDSGYPAPEPTIPPNLSAEPPNPEILLPENAKEDVAVVGGALVQSIADTGYVPFKPIKLYLGEVLVTESGVQSHMRRSSSSPLAELYDTGVFIFQDVPPGTYGLIADLAMSQFVIDQDGEPILLTLAEGDVIDLGQIIITLPGIE